MFKYKGSIVLGLVLGFFLFFLPTFYLEFSNFSLLQFFYALPDVRATNVSIWLITLVIIYLLLYIVTILLLPFLKENRLKIKCSLLILCDLLGYLALILMIAPTFFSVKDHLSWGVFIVVGWLVILLGLSFYLPIKKATESEEIQETNDDSKQVPIEAHEPETFQAPTITDNSSSINAAEEPTTEMKTDVPTSYSSSAKEMLTFNDLKQLSKILVFINLAMLIGFFITWNSDISKTTGIILFLSGNGWLDIFSKAIVLTLIHLLLSNILFFKNRNYLLAASFINDIIVIIAWLRALDLIQFVNMALAPLVCLGLAILSMTMIIFSIHKINQNNTYQIHLLTEIKSYLKAMFIVFKKAFQSLSLMVKEWKD